MALKKGSIAYRKAKAGIATVARAAKPSAPSAPSGRAPTPTEKKVPVKDAPPPVGTPGRAEWFKARARLEREKSFPGTYSEAEVKAAKELQTAVEQQVAAGWREIREGVYQVKTPTGVRTVYGEEALAKATTPKEEVRLEAGMRAEEAAMAVARARGEVYAFEEDVERGTYKIITPDKTETIATPTGVIKVKEVTPPTVVGITPKGKRRVAKMKEGIEVGAPSYFFEMERAKLREKERKAKEALGVPPEPTFEEKYAMEKAKEARPYFEKGSEFLEEKPKPPPPLPPKEDVWQRIARESILGKGTFAEIKERKDYIVTPEKKRDFLGLPREAAKGVMVTGLALFGDEKARRAVKAPFVKIKEYITGRTKEVKAYLGEVKEKVPALKVKKFPLGAVGVVAPYATKKVKEKIEPYREPTRKKVKEVVTSIYPHFKESIRREWKTPIIPGKPKTAMYEILGTAKGGYEWGYGEVRRARKKLGKEPSQIKGAARFALWTGETTLGKLAGATEWLQEKPEQLPILYAGAYAISWATAPLATLPGAKAIGYGLEATVATGIGVEAYLTPPGLPREKKIGERLAQLTAFGLGAYAQRGVALKKKLTKKIRAQFEALPPEQQKTIAEAYLKAKGLEEVGRPGTTIPLLKKKIVGYKPREIDIFGRKIKYRTPLLGAIEKAKVSTELVDLKSQMAKTDIQYAAVERFQAYPLAARAAQQVAQQTPSVIVGGSLVPFSLYQPEFLKMGKLPSDWDVYIRKTIGETKEIGAVGRTIVRGLGEAGVPAKAVMPRPPAEMLLPEQVYGLKLARRGRIGGGLGAALQLPAEAGFRDITKADIDVEFKRLTKETAVTKAKGFLKKLEKKYPDKFEMDVARHALIRWGETPEVPKYLRGRTFMDIGKLRTEYKVGKKVQKYRTRKVGGQTLMDIRDIMADKQAIAKYLKPTTPIAKAKIAKAKADIFAIKKGIGEMYPAEGRIGFEYKKETPAFKVFLGEGIGAPREKGLEIHGYGTMLAPNIRAVTAPLEFPSTYIWRAAGGERVFAPYIQKKRAIAGAFGDLRLKDIPKFVAMTKGEIRLGRIEAEKDIFKKRKLAKLAEYEKEVKEFEQLPFVKEAYAEEKLEAISGKDFRKTIAKVGEEAFFKEPKAKKIKEEFGAGVIGSILKRKPKPPVKYPEYKTYFVSPLVTKPKKPKKYEPYEEYKIPTISYPAYKPYKAYPVTYATYPAYKPYPAYPAYKPSYKPYPKYKPYPPYKPTKYTPYPAYKPYPIYKPSYKPYPKYKPYKPYPPLIMGLPIVPFKLPKARTAFKMPRMDIAPRYAASIYGIEMYKALGTTIYRAPSVVGPGIRYVTKAMAVDARKVGFFAKPRKAKKKTKRRKR